MHRLSLLAALLGLVTPLAAQERRAVVDTVEREVRVFIEGQEPMPRTFEMVVQRRARLGVGVSLESRDTDSLGAYVQSVTPGGPAAKAGLRAGDIITRIDEDPLTPSRGRRGRDATSPGERLVELLAAVAPGDTVKVEYLRDGARRSVAIVTADEPMLGASGEDTRAFVWQMPDGRGRQLRVPRLPGMILEGGPDMPGRIEIERVGPGGAAMLTAGPLANLELAPLNPDLGGYFGTTEGVLVIKAPAGSSLGVKGGDVILTVDGRKPANPNSLVRILRSYEANETFRLEILRQKKRETVTGSLGRAGRDE